MAVDPYAVGWAVFGAAGVVYELALVATGHRDRTLSAYIRRALGLEPRQSWSTLGIVVVFAVAAWLVIHLGFGIWP